MSYLWAVLRMVIGLIFAYSGFSKLMEPAENFMAIISNYEIIPKFAVPLAAYMVPWFEWIFGSLLCLGYAPRYSAFAVALLDLALVFIVLIKVVTGTAAGLDCGCFGEMGIHLSMQHVLIMDAVNLAILIRLIFLRKHIWSMDAIIELFEQVKKPSLIVKKRKKF